MEKKSSRLPDKKEVRHLPSVHLLSVMTVTLIEDDCLKEQSASEKYYLPLVREVFIPLVIHSGCPLNGLINITEYVASLNHR